MRRIYIRLTKDQADAMTRIAEAERRHPADQAALMLEPVIERLMEQQNLKKEAVLT